MPRPRCRKNISFLPSVTYFKPAGVKLRDMEEVVLQHDELEAIRLKDLLGIAQEEAARQMNVSQPTLHRLLVSAHEKLAHAVVNGKALRIEGGNVAVDQQYIPPCGWRHICRHGWSEKTPSADIAGRDGNKGGTMKIAVTSTDGALDGMIDERFGRARKIVVYDKEKASHIVVDNSVNMNSPQGAGIQSAQNVVNSGASAVISGHLGPNAFRVLNSAEIEVYTASQMTVAEAIKAFEQGKLSKLTGPDVEGHW